MSAEPPTSPEAKLARILAWLHEKFTRNFSVGKDLWELVKTHPNDPFFKQFRPKTAILLVRTVVGQLSAIASFIRCSHAIGRSSNAPQHHRNPAMTQAGAAGGVPIRH
jgi:hypothetical protein